MYTIDKEIKFISGIYATQHRDWCHRIAINVKQFEEQFKFFKENANEKGFYEFEMLKSKKGKLCVMLLPVSTSTKLFHHYILPYKKEIRFVFKRIKFKIHK